MVSSVVNVGLFLLDLDCRNSEFQYVKQPRGTLQNGLVFHSLLTGTIHVHVVVVDVRGEVFSLNLQLCSDGVLTWRVILAFSRLLLL